MARKAKPPASVLVFSGSRWASLDEGFAWAEGALGSSYLAENDLTEHFRSGRLPTAMRHRRDGVDTFERLEPPFWKRLQVGEPDENGDVRVWGLAAEIASFAPHFFVEREPLEQLYSPGLVIEPASDASPASDAPTRRRPGPQPIKDWPTLVARELIRRAKAGEKEPTAIKMIELCERAIGYSPVLREMQKLLKKLR
jgi:hypothetical protein